MERISLYFNLINGHIVLIFLHIYEGRISIYFNLINVLVAPIFLLVEEEQITVLFNLMKAHVDESLTCVQGTNNCNFLTYLRGTNIYIFYLDQYSCSSNFLTRLGGTNSCTF